MRWLATAVALCLSISMSLSVALGLSNDIGASGPTAAPRRAGPGLVLIILDTVSACDVGLSTRGGGATPRINALAAAGVRFANARTTAPWTQPAVASILTGRLPSRHGVLRLDDVLPARELTLAEVLSGAGFRTGGVISNMLLEERFGVAQGFEHWDADAVAGHRGITSAKVTAAAIRWLARRNDEPFLLLVHYFDPHLVYHDHPGITFANGYHGPLRPAMGIWRLREARARMTEADVAYLRALHAEEVAWVDSSVGRLLDALDQQGLTRRTTVMLVADHGEEIMEHGWIGHTRSLHDELIHVPLIIRSPGAARGLVLDDPVSVVDLLPTALDLVGVDAPRRELDGRSLAPLLRPEPSASTWPVRMLRAVRTWLSPDRAAGPVRGAAEGQAGHRAQLAEVSFTLGPTDGPRQMEKVAFKTAVVDGRYKLIHDLLSDDLTLFDLETDPDEHNPLSADHPELGRLAARLRDWERQRQTWGPDDTAPRTLLDENERQRLRALGYTR